MAAALALAPLSLAACATPAGSGGAVTGTGAGVPAATLSQPFVDTAGRSWAPVVERSYISAVGSDCSMVALTPLAGGLPIRRAVCAEGGKWVVLAPLSLAPGEADPRFSPISGAPQTGSVSSAPSPYADRSAS